MKSTKEIIHAFIVRIWVEPREVKNAEPIWRGIIEDTEDDEQMSFDHLEKMQAYFAKYLKKFGIDINN